jgi:hypothetical protein
LDSVFLPVAPAQAKEVIAALAAQANGIELIPIPALGGCVVAVKEVATERPGFLGFIHDMGRKERMHWILTTLDSYLEPKDAA